MTTSAFDDSAMHRTVAVAYGVLCHSLFVAGVGAMIIAMFFEMSRSLGLLPTPWGLIALLLIQFPVAHSFLLTSKGRSVPSHPAPQRIGSRLATTTYAAIASIQLLLLFALWSPSGIVWWRAEGPVLVALSCLYAATWLMLAKAIFDAGYALQTGLLGWRAVARGGAPKFPSDARQGPVSHQTADISGSRPDPVDRADMDSGPTRNG